MINFVINSTERYSVSFTPTQRAFGSSVWDLRECIEVDIYQAASDGMYHVARGMSIRHPTDVFDPRIGAKKALASAMVGWDRDTRILMQLQLDEWFDY